MSCECGSGKVDTYSPETKGFDCDDCRPFVMAYDLSQRIGWLLEPENLDNLDTVEAVELLTEARDLLDQLSERGAT